MRGRGAAAAEESYAANAFLKPAVPSGSSPGGRSRLEPVSNYRYREKVCNWAGFFPGPGPQSPPPVNGERFALFSLTFLSYFSGKELIRMRGSPGR